jgi:hypothetical protein
MNKFKKEILDIVMSDDVTSRKYICENDFKYFFIYYLSEYIKYPFAQFHFEIFEALSNLNQGELKDSGEEGFAIGKKGALRELALICFRESAKTSIIKAYITWCILFKKHKFIVVDSYEKGNSEAILFDIIIELQSNQKILNDFGSIYNDGENQGGEFKVSKLKRRTEFITTKAGGEIKVMAYSTQESLRGKLHQNHRPSLYINDDFENNKTKDSERVSQKIIEHFQEGFGGLDPNAAIIWLGNYITDKGSVQWLFNRASTDDAIKIFNIPLFTISPEGEKKLTWKEKYCFSKEEASLSGKVSVEELEKKLSPSVFQVEMMNNPYANENSIFKRDWFKYRTHDELKKLISLYNLKCYITIDTATGQGKDYNAIVINYVDTSGCWNFMAFRNKDNASQLVDNIFGLYKTYKPIRIGIEKTTYTMGFMTFLQQEMRTRQTFLPLMELLHGGKKKEERIKNTLETRYANGSIFHIQGYTKELEDELLKFPFGLNDDICDSAGFMDQMAKPNMTVNVVAGNTYSL